ncbi:MAG TPA: FKBP-type peptidyl-prolyl cis-trans isomerase [Candidatus Paceibacterota bacterium]|nr:FKBP-type peptidyl-prolyl cis-trans isomerase [Candidatus Paceibacterota bacterium]
MKYIAVAIVVIVLGVLVGASVRSDKNAGLEPSTPPPVLAVTESPADQAKAPLPEQSKKKTMEKEGVTIQVLKEGTGPEIKVGSTAVVHYTGQLVDGKVFDSSKPRGTPFEFALGAGMVIKGWDIGVAGMKVGEQRKLTIPPALAYGASGVPGAIPANATLIFEVELLGIK